MSHRRFSVRVLLIALVATACSTNSAPSSTVATTADVTTTFQTSTSAARPATTTTSPVGESPEPRTLGIGDPIFPRLGNPGFDIDHYDLALTYDPETGHLSGLATITATADATLSTFNLDFSSLDVVSVTVDGETAATARSNFDIVIAPTRPPAAGDRFVVTVEYEGTPRPVIDTGIPFGIGWTTTRSGTYVVAEPAAASSWFPGNDHPTDKATYTFRVTVPDGIVAIANGTLTDTITDLGWSTWVWEMRHPMATYLATVVTGPYELIDDADATATAGVPVRNALLSGRDTGVALELQGDMIAHLANLFGPYPFDAYGIVVVEDLEAALETQSFPVFGEGIVQNPASFERILVHELAHQWFGDLVSPATWRDTWLNEGFASYGEWLWTEHRNGREALETGIRAERNRLAARSLAPPADPPDDQLFGASVYRVGAMALHALRLEVGDEAFFRTLRTYLERHAYGTASTGDFIAVAEEVAGRSLDDLFQAWLFDPEIPEFPAG